MHRSLQIKLKNTLGKVRLAKTLNLARPTKNVAMRCILGAEHVKMHFRPKLHPNGKAYSTPQKDPPISWISRAEK